MDKTPHTPLISIIMNCYNSSRYLSEAIEGVLNQTYSSWELIFWDNQSTDGSSKIYKSYADTRLKYFYADRHTALSTARNLAIEKATGEIIGFIDCDDIWMPNKLEEQVPYFINEDVGIVYSDFNLILDSEDNSAKKMYQAFRKLSCEPHPAKDIYKKLLLGNFIIFSTVLIRKSVYYLTGGFSEEFSQDEDYEVLIKSSLYSKAVCISSQAVHYRIHSSNNSYQNKEASFLENRAILGSLPFGKEVSRARNRNEARYLIHRILWYKKPSLFSFFFSFEMITGLTDAIRLKICKKVLGNKNLR